MIYLSSKHQTITTLLALCILFLFPITLGAQIEELYPSSIEIIELSIQGDEEHSKAVAAAWAINKKRFSVKEYSLTDEEKEILSKVDLDINAKGYWKAKDGGCSWYCGGGPTEVTASSYHQISEDSLSNLPSNAHDLTFNTAWAEGVDGYGIGEYILYTFAPSSPRIDEIIIYNGNALGENEWKNNSRVKKFKVYLNDKALYNLNLKDIRGTQHFKIAPIGYTDRKNYEELKNKETLNLKFEIAEIFEGLKYDHVVISEIFFDGLDVHCFVKGTKILMEHGKMKNIEDMKIGDRVVFFDFESNQYKVSKIEKLNAAIHNHLVKYTFENGHEITSTQDHPFLLANEGWASLNPVSSAHYIGFENISTIQLGDLFVSPNGNRKLISYEILNEELKTYTISKLSTGDNFIANGFVVGVEKLNQMKLKPVAVTRTD